MFRWRVIFPSMTGQQMSTAELLLGSNCKAEQTEIQARLVQVSMKRSIGINFCNAGFPSSSRQVCF